MGWLLQFTANCREPYDCGGRIWSLAICTNRAFCNKFAVFASKLRQTACFAISLQQTAANRIFYNKFTANRIFCNMNYTNRTNRINCMNRTNCTNCINYNYIIIKILYITTGCYNILLNIFIL